MSLSLLQRLRRQARARVLRAVAGFALPWLAASAAIGWRIGGLAWALPVGVLVLATAMAWRQWRGFDLEGVARALDAGVPALEDSTGLLLQEAGALGALAALQRERVRTRLAALSPPPSLGPAPPWKAWGWSALAALGLALATWFLLATPAPPASVAALVPRAVVPLPPGLRAAELQVQPPAYTDLPARRVDGLAARVPEGAVVTWRLRTQGSPAAVALRFHDGSTLALARDGAHWTLQRRIDRATLYRVRVDGRDSPWQRIGVIADRPPRLRVHAPDRSLTLVEPDQARWALDLEASDDYGLGAAQLRITLAQGSGDNIQVSARTLALAGSGGARQRRYRDSLDLRALGFAAGDDLVVRVSVSDNRRPTAQVARSASFILRWPPELGAQASGVEGLVQRTLPTYFRSQRQIIIDTEALLALRPRPADFAARSDTIGVDQRLLRLRYGQFLGEEAEEPGHEEEHDAGAPPAEENAATALVEQFGHVHDIPEAATLLDPETRKLLKSALDAMWQAEGELRLGRPAQALPHEYRALRFIKQVQQANRIYLARVGLELAPVDMARRLGGKREGIAPRQAPAVAPAADAPAPALALWTALQRGELESARRAAEAWEAQVGAEPDAEDALAVLAALDRWRADPRCDRCVADLRAALWPRLPATPAALAPRERADARGRAYLEALDAVDAPRANAPSATGDTP